MDSGYKTIKADNIDEMVGLGMNSTEYRNYKRRESLEKRLKILSTHCHMKNH